MTRAFWICTTAIFAAFAGYELWLNLNLRAVNDDVLAVCYGPGIGRPVPEVFVYTSEQIKKPMSRSVMR